MFKGNRIYSGAKWGFKDWYFFSPVKKGSEESKEVLRCPWMLWLGAVVSIAAGGTGHQPRRSLGHLQLLLTAQHRRRM